MLVLQSFFVKVLPGQSLKKIVTNLWLQQFYLTSYMVMEFVSLNEYLAEGQIGSAI